MFIPSQFSSGSSDFVQPVRTTEYQVGGSSGETPRVGRQALSGLQSESDYTLDRLRHRTNPAITGSFLKSLSEQIGPNDLVFQNEVSTGLTLLQAAVAKSDCKLVASLLENRGNPNQLSQMGTALHIACAVAASSDGNSEARQILTQLIGAGANPNIQRQSDGRTPLDELCAHASGNLDLVKQLSDVGATFGQLPGEQLPRTPPLILALMGGADMNFIESLLKDLRLSPNAMDPKTKRTALHEALMSSSIQVLGLLVGWGADLTALDGDGKPPFIVALENHWVDEALALLPCPLNPEFYDQAMDWLDTHPNFKYWDLITSNLMRNLAAGAGGTRQLSQRVRSGIPESNAPAPFEVNGVGQSFFEEGRRPTNVVSVAGQAAASQVPHRPDANDCMTLERLRDKQAPTLTKSCLIGLSNKQTLPNEIVYDDGSYKGLTFLQLAVWQSNHSLVDELLKKGGDPNKLGREGTALHIACAIEANGGPSTGEMAKKTTDLLLRKGANPNCQRPSDGCTPFDMACAYAWSNLNVNYDLIKRLIENRADPDSFHPGTYLRTPPLILAIRRGVKSEFIKRLITHFGLDPNLIDPKTGNTALHEAIEKKNDKTLKSLLACKVVDAGVLHGTRKIPPLVLAMRLGNEEAVRRLAQYGLSSEFHLDVPKRFTDSLSPALEVQGKGRQRFRFPPTAQTTSMPTAQLGYSSSNFIPEPTPPSDPADEFLHEDSPLTLDENPTRFIDPAMISQQPIPQTVPASLRFFSGSNVDQGITESSPTLESVGEVLSGDESGEAAVVTVDDLELVRGEPQPHSQNSPPFATEGVGAPLHPVVDVGEGRGFSRPQIADKYLVEKSDRLPNIVRSSGASSEETWKASYSFSCLDNLQEPVPVESVCVEFGENQFELFTNSSSLNWKDCERCTFVLAAGRKERALVPQEEVGGRVVIVLPESQRGAAKNFVAPLRDVLLIKSVEQSETNSLPADLRIGIAAFAKGQGIERLMMLDDNVKGFAFGNALDNWRDIYNHFFKIMDDKEVSLLTVQSYSDDLHPELPKDKTPTIDSSKFGAKVFAMDLEQVKGLGRDLWPEDTADWGEDLNCQFAYGCLGLKVAAIHRSHAVIKRSKKDKNSCEGKLNSAEKWLSHSNRPGASALTCATTEKMKEHVEKGYDHYRKRRVAIEGLDLGTFTGLSASVMDDSELESPAIESTPNSRKRSRSASKSTLRGRDVPKVQHLSSCQMALEVVDHIGELEDWSWRFGQEDALVALTDHFKQGKNIGQVNMATGSGKTPLFAHFAVHLANRLQAGKSVLVLSPRKTIDNQIAEQLQKCSKSLQNVTVATVDSSANNVPTRALELNKQFQNEGKHVVVMCMASARDLFLRNSNELERFGAIIVDESHSTTLNLANYLNAYAEKSKALLLGFSATPDKGGQGVRKAFGDEILKYGLEDAVEDGCCTPWTIEHLKNMGSMDATDQLANSIIAKLHSARSNQQPLAQLPGIIYTGQINTAKAIAAKLNKGDINSRAIHSNQTSSLQHRILNKFNSGELNVLVTAQMLQEGYDGRPRWAQFVDNASNRLTEDLARQILGRVVRHDEKLADKEAWFGVVSTEDARRHVIDGIVEKLTLRGDRFRRRVMSQDADLNTELHRAVLANNADHAASLAEYEWAPLDVQNAEGNTPIHLSIIQGNKRLTRTFLSVGMRNIPGANNLGETPLHLAVQNKWLGVVQSMLGLGRCDDIIDARDRNGDTALHIAVKEKLPGIVQKLLSNDAKILPNKQGCTPIDLAEKGSELRRWLQRQVL